LPWNRSIQLIELIPRGILFDFVVNKIEGQLSKTINRLNNCIGELTGLVIITWRKCTFS
jgi:hypothetical protein